MKKTLLIIAILSFGAACIEDQADGSIEETRDDAKQSVFVIPQFEIDDADDIPVSSRLEEIGLKVSKLQFTPVDIDSNTSVDPILVEFNLSDGQVILETGQIQLPKSGRYNVSIELETETAQDTNASQSFFMVGSFDEVITPDEENDGWPQPVLDETQDDKDNKKDASKTGEVSKETTYRTDRSVSIHFSDVEFTGGTQPVVFAFDTSNFDSAKDSEMATKKIDDLDAVETSGEDASSSENQTR